MTTLLIAVAAMMIGAVIGFLTARLICGTASAVQLSPYISSPGDMSSRVEMYRRRAADAKQRAAQAKGPSIAIALEYEAAFWLGLAEQLEWTGRGAGERWTDRGRFANEAAARNSTAAPTSSRIIATTAIMNVVILRHPEAPGGAKATGATESSSQYVNQSR
jgi:hypothetical protein